MKGNFAAIVLVVVGALALAVNLELITIDLMQIVRTWWPLVLILIGVALYFTPEPGDRKKSRISRGNRGGETGKEKYEKYVALQQFFGIMISVSSIPSSFGNGFKACAQQRGLFFRPGDAISPLPYMTQIKARA